MDVSQHDRRDQVDVSPMTSNTGLPRIWKAPASRLSFFNAVILADTAQLLQMLQSPI